MAAIEADRVGSENREKGKANGPISLGPGRLIKYFHLSSLQRLNHNALLNRQWGVLSKGYPMVLFGIQGFGE